MNFLVVAHDIPNHKAHLLPWRTACEITNGLRALGHRAILVSLDNYSGPLTGGALPDNSVAISKQRGELKSRLQQLALDFKPDVIFWPVSWRDPGHRSAALAEIDSRIVGWFPGGAYDRATAFYALRKLGPKAALPYLREAWASKSRQLDHWRNGGVSQWLTMTEYTADAARNAGCLATAVRAIPPGREDVDKMPAAADLPADAGAWLGDRKYFLFMGPPSAIRGVFELLTAFEKAAAQLADITLVCLFRSDGVLDRVAIEQHIAGLTSRERIFVRWESLSPEELNSFIKACHVLVMPFVVVPSEIPLAIIEAARWCKPVITTGPGGTSEYVEQFGLAPRVGDNAALARALISLASDTQLYQHKSDNAANIYNAHPTWREVAHQWLDFTEDVSAS